MGVGNGEGKKLGEVGSTDHLCQLKLVLLVCQEEAQLWGSPVVGQ